MAIWRQIKQSQMKALSTHLKRSYFQIHTPCGMNYSSSRFKITVCSSPSLYHHRSPLDFPATNLRFYAAPSQAIQKKEADGPRLNEEITADVVRLVTEEGHTVMPRHKALGVARSQKLDLVEVQRNATPPVCKIMDYKREMFQKSTKEKERVKEKSGGKLKTGACKEIRFAGKITQQDLQIKADMVKRLMERGHRVKCLAVGKTIKQTGQAENSKSLLSRFLSLIEDISVVESDSRVGKKDQEQKNDAQATEKEGDTGAAEKDQEHVIVRHIKFGPLKKGLGKNAGKGNKSPSATAQERTSENDVESEENIFSNENLIASTSSIPVPELEYMGRQKTSPLSSGGTENRYMENSRDRSQPNNPTDGRTSLRSPFPNGGNQPQFNTNPSFQQRKPEYVDNRSPPVHNTKFHEQSPSFNPRQANNTPGEQNQQTVVNRYMQRNPSESARDSRPGGITGRPNSAPFPNPRFGREQAVDKDHRQANNTLGEQSQQTVVNRYKPRNPSESARDSRPGGITSHPNSPFPNPRVSREQAVDKDNQGRWGIFSGEGSGRIPDRKVEGQGAKVTSP